MQLLSVKKREVSVGFHSKLRDMVVAVITDHVLVVFVCLSTMSLLCLQSGWWLLSQNAQSLWRNNLCNLSFRFLNLLCIGVSSTVALKKQQSVQLFIFFFWTCFVLGGSSTDAVICRDDFFIWNKYGIFSPFELYSVTMDVLQKTIQSIYSVEVPILLHLKHQ